MCKDFKLIALLSFVQTDISVLTYSYNSQHFLLLFSLGFNCPQGISFLADFVREVLVIVRKMTGHGVGTYHVGCQLGSFVLNDVKFAFVLVFLNVFSSSCLFEYCEVLVNVTDNDKVLVK